jgi:hypothetical protein
VQIGWMALEREQNGPTSKGPGDLVLTAVGARGPNPWSQRQLTVGKDAIIGDRCSCATPSDSQRPSERCELCWELPQNSRSGSTQGPAVEIPDCQGLETTVAATQETSETGHASVDENAASERPERNLWIGHGGLAEVPSPSARNML